MNTESNYVTNKTDKSFCPTCSKTVTMLAPFDMATYPWFYICWNCQTIFEIGKGECLEVKKAG